MESEPRDLSQARELLGRFEEQENKPSGLGYLEGGLAMLSRVIEDDRSGRYKVIAQNLMGSYRKRVFSKTKAMLSNPESFAMESAEHWCRVTKAFLDAGFGDDQEFNDCHERLRENWIRQLVRSLSPFERQQLIRELERANKPTKEQSSN